MADQIYDKIVIRNDTEANWISANPVLLAGEIGITINTVPKKFKIGDGTSVWSSLEYVISSVNISDIPGLQDALDAKENEFTKNTAFNKNFGTTGGTVCEGNDSRLSDSRNPLSHNQDMDTINGLEIALSNKEPVKGTDDNYVTDAQLAVIANTSGINTGDQDLSGLQPKETGKGLSTNDYTTTDKAKVDTIVITGDGSQYLANDGTYKTIAGGLTNWTESNYLYSTKYGVKFTPNSTQTNVDVVLQPKGTGAIIAQQPDGTVVGGDNRGANAVDLQTSRAFAGRVAAKASTVIAGGYSNVADGNYAVVVGGYSNAATSIYTFVGGGSSNIASGNYSNIGGGTSNTASGQYSIVGGGSSNTASGAYSATGGGSFNTASSTNTFAVGGYSVANKSGQFAHSSGRFSSNGDAQTSQLTMLRQTTNETPTELFLDGSSARLTIENNSMLSCEIWIQGKKSGAVDGYSYRRFVRIAKGTTAASTVIKGSIDVIGTDYEADEGANVEITADTVNGSLKIMVTGIAGTTINWMALVKNIELVKA